MVNYEKFYLALGMNTPARFKDIRRHPISEFVFPKNSVWHHINPTTTPYEDPSFTKVEDGYVEPVIEFVALSEKVIYKPVIKSRKFKEILDAISIYPNLKVLKKSIAMIPNINTVVIETYDSFKERLIFKDTPAEKYLQTLSYLASVIKRIEDTAAFSERNHFIPIYINQNEKPSKSIFNIILKRGLNTTYMRIFHVLDQCLMLELMRFSLGEKSIFTGVSSKALSKINFVFRGTTQESVLNLGLMLRMIAQEDDEDSTGTIKPVKAKNILLRMNLVIGDEHIALDHSDDDDDSEITELDYEIESDDDTATQDEVVYDDDLIHNDLSTLENIARKRQSEESIDIDAEPVYNAKPIKPNERTTATAKKLLDKGVLTNAEYNRIANSSHGIDKIPSPDGNGSLADYLNYSQDDLKITSPFRMVDRDTIVDKSLLESTLVDFDSRYIKEFMHKDAIKFALGVQNADVIVRDLRVEEHEDIANHYTQFTMSIELVPGGVQTITFPLPVFDERGVTEIGGVNYYLKKQDGEMPIRKTKKNQVSLTSYYGKLFVERNDAVAYNYSNFLTKFVIRTGMDTDNNTITNVKVGNVFYKHTKLPRSYTAMSEKIVSFTISNEIIHTVLYFDYLNREKLGTETLRIEKEMNGVVVGHTHHGAGRSTNKANRYIVLGMDDVLRTYEEGIIRDLGSFETVINVSGKIPLEYVTVNIFGKPIPIVFLLGYKLGLGTLCKLLKVTPRKVKSGGRLDLANDEFRIRFKNESWVFSKRNATAALIFAGFAKYDKYTSTYSSSLYKDPEVYSLLLSDMGFGKRHYVEMKVIYDMFIDHITQELLAEMKEPTDMVNLFVRAVDLLATDEYPDEGDGNYMRIKGYERVAAGVYSEMVKSVRAMYFKSRSKRSRLDFNPMGVKMHLLTDSAKEVYDEINPVHALKQQEICTLSGHGGRNSDAIAKNIKGFHATDVGVKSESNVDSGNVGVITYLAANPNLTSLRGTRGTMDANVASAANLVSRSALLGVAVDQDDMKRIIFSGIQNSHVIPCAGYEVPPLVTGYEQVLGQQTDDLFSYTAEQAGTVTKLNSRIIEVTYTDGTKKVCRIGTRHGKTKGEVIPHELVTSLKLNDPVKAGDCIVSNTNFFDIDPFLGLAAKTAVMARVALVDDKDNHEDSVSMSIEFCGKMASKHTVVRNVLIDFDKTIHNVATVGDNLEAESKLMYIEDEITSRSDIINERAADILSKLSRNAPSARSGGVVDLIEIRYRGELDDMSPSLRDLAFELDRQLARSRRESNKKVITNRVDESYRVEGNPLEKDQAVIIFYITSNIPTGTGDKYLLGNQMKATNSRVVKGEFKDSRGLPIDMTMAVRSFENRKVNSLKVIGFNIECIRLVQDKLIDMLEE